MNYSTLLTENNNSNIRVLANQISFQTWGTRGIQSGVSLDTNLAAASNVTVMTILGSNVGIGSTRPSQVLDVAGSIRFTGNLFNNNNQVAFNWSRSNTVVYVDKGITIGVGTSNTGGNDLYINGSTVTSNLTVLGNFFIANDNLAIRNALQVAPTNSSFTVQTSSQSNFSLTQSGIYQATPDKTEVYVNGVKLAYSNATYKDYDVQTYVNNGTDSIYVITTTYPCGYGDVVDITVWPSFVSTSATFRSGYVYQQISNTLWSSNGTNAYYTQTGAVGIGKTNPDNTNYKLDIAGGCKATGMQADRFYIGNWNDNTSSNTEPRGPWYGVGPVADFPNDGRTRTQLAGYYGLSLKTAGNYMYMSQGGNLGIGTTNPVQQLHITSSAFLGDATYSFLNNSTLTTANGRRLFFDNTYNGTPGSGVNANKILLYSTTNWVGGFGIEGSAVTYHSGQNHNFYTGATQSAYGSLAMTLAGQSVGIGTASPAYTLDVAGTARIGTSSSGKLIISGGTKAEIIHSNITANVNEKAWGASTLNNTFIWYSIFDSGSVNAIYMTASRTGADVTSIGLTPSTSVYIGTPTVRATFDSYGTINARNGILVPTGGIGIGTTTPTVSLDVYGAVDITQNGTGGGSLRVAPSTANAEASIGFYPNSNLSGTFWTFGQGTCNVGVNNLGLGVNSVTNSVMTWLNNGNVGIGSTTPISRLDVNGTIASSISSTSTYATNTTPTLQNAIIQNTNTSTASNIFTNLTFQLSPANAFGSGGRAQCDQRFVRKTAATSEASLIWGACNSGGTTYQDVMELNTNSGNLVVLGDITCFNVFSDARLKTNITPITSSLKRLEELIPVEYVWRDDIPYVQKRGAPDVGLIAQDVATIFPRVVTNVDVPGSDNEKYMGIKYDKLVPYLICAIQELSEKYDALLSEVAELRMASTQI